MESTSQEATSAGDLKLIPNIKYLFDCPFYWGKIDKDKVMSMFEGKSDGRFLLKDSEGEEFALALWFKFQSQNGKSTVRYGLIKFNHVKKESNKDNCPSCKSNIPNHHHVKYLEHRRI